MINDDDSAASGYLNPHDASTARALVRGTNRALDSYDKTLDEVGSLGKWMTRTTLADALSNGVGLIDDYLVLKRQKNLLKIMEGAKAILKARGIEEPADPSPALTEAILTGAADESREELQKLWTALLANALDPSRNNTLRPEFIVIVKAMHPVDALVISAISDLAKTGLLHKDESYKDVVSQRLGIESIIVGVSLTQLEDMKLLSRINLRYTLSDFGRLFQMAVSKNT